MDTNELHETFETITVADLRVADVVRIEANGEALEGMITDIKFFTHETVFGVAGWYNGRDIALVPLAARNDRPVLRFVGVE
jgi:hypothetical protein